jgi:hypothetical protein
MPPLPAVAEPWPEAEAAPPRAPVAPRPPRELLLPEFALTLTVFDTCASLSLVTVIEPALAAGAAAVKARASTVMNEVTLDIMCCFYK